MFFKKEASKLSTDTSPTPVLQSPPPQVVPEEVIAHSPKNVDVDQFTDGNLVIGSGVHLQGTLTVPIKTTVSGLIRGNLATADLAVNPGGTVQGQVDCQTADIAGQVENLLQVHQYLILRSSAVAIGDIYYQEIAIEKGAKITGKLIRL